MFRAAIAALALVLAPGAAVAQITTYVAPARPLQTPQMVAAADSARRDSVTVAEMTNMKAWVDSAAGVSVPARVGDTTLADSLPEVRVTTFADGSVAPNTASALPALAVFGVATLAVGTVLLARRPPRG